MGTPYDQALVRRDGQVWKRHGQRPLCEVCGIQHNCALKQALTVLAKQRNAEAVIPKCGVYMPVISFQDRTGIDGHFNTFRRGRGWSNRLLFGQRVAVFDLFGKALLGTATVGVLEVGPLDEMLAAHAASNHLMKAQPGREAPALLHQVLRRLYGNNYAGLDMTYSVIGLNMEDA